MTQLTCRLLREQSGISLVELLLSMVLMLIVLGATLTTFTNFERDSARAANLNDSQDAVRRNVGQLVGQLRNLASPNANAPEAVERAQPTDLVFRTVDPVGPNAGLNEGNVYRVRYCLESGSPALLWMQWQTWTTSTPPAVPADGGACPGPGWPVDNRRVVAQGVTNDGRAVFTYNAAQTAAISVINVDLFVDMDPLRPPGETRLQSGAFLRNQNRAPTAAFTATATAGGKVVLNGSASSDPEGQPLRYVWKEGVPGQHTDGRDETGERKLGEGVTCECPTNEQLAPGTYTVWLEVKDPGGLSAMSSTQAVTIS